MGVLLGTVLLSFTLIVAGSNQFRSDYKYHAGAIGWFKLHKEPATWEDARLRCSLEGAVLASPITVDVSDVMHSILSKAGHQTFKAYTGVHNTISPTQFESIEGVPLYKMPVGKCEMFPKEYKGAPSCMRMVASGALEAGGCVERLPYLCYRKRTEELAVTECGTIDRGYHLDNRTGHCYKFHKEALRWSLAYLTCAAEGGYLAIPNSAEEGALIRDLYAQYPPESILGPNGGGIHLGFYEWNENRIWRTIHGQSLEEAGFALWSGSQPDNAVVNGEGQHCGSMFRSGLLDDVWCSYLYAFICEKDPSSLRHDPSQCTW